MFTDDQALVAGRTIRPLLPQLLSPEVAEQIDQQLAQILNQNNLDESTKADQLLAILDAYPETKTWLDQFLELPLVEKRYSGLPGNPHLADATPYICPVGNDYIWYREANEEIPLCPTHLVRLELAQA